MRLNIGLGYDDLRFLHKSHNMVVHTSKTTKM